MHHRHEGGTVCEGLTQGSVQPYFALMILATGTIPGHCRGTVRPGVQGMRESSALLSDIQAKATSTMPCRCDSSSKGFLLSGSGARRRGARQLYRRGTRWAARRGTGIALLAKTFLEESQQTLEWHRGDGIARSIWRSGTTMTWACKPERAEEWLRA